MNEIPILSDLTIQLQERKPSFFWWSCNFSVINDRHKYLIHINCEEFKRGFRWHYARPDVLPVRKKEWEKPKNRSAQWSDHIFEQCIKVIKLHSKDRLKLINYFDKDYLSYDFHPSNYPLPINMTINEEI